MKSAAPLPGRCWKIRGALSFSTNWKKRTAIYSIVSTTFWIPRAAAKKVPAAPWISAGAFFLPRVMQAWKALRATREESGNDPVAWLGRSRDALVDAAGFDRAFLARWSAIYFMDELSPLHVAEVACLQLARHWRTYGIEVRHASPELILDAVQRNEEFKQYGVRQLGAYIQMKTSPAIGQARTRGIKKVNLTVGSAGTLEISPVEER